jgi:glycosyltransferase involved in cell wall biosynthesis
MARHRGIRSAFYLASPSYRDSTVFEDADVVICVSESLRARLGLAEDPRVAVTGSVVDVARHRANARTPEYVVFVNPLAEKGLSLFASLTSLSERRGRRHRFLVVESRGVWAQALRLFPGLGERRNLTVLPSQPDMRSVYSRAAALLFPSVWPEPSGRVPIEAGANGIPVLAYDVGGIRETLPDGAILFEPSPPVVADHRAPTPEADAQVWLDALDALASDPAYCAQQAERARAAAARRDPEPIVDRIEALLAAR